MLTKYKYDKEIKNIVEQLIKLYKPEKIILFGSLVKDEIREGTDIDMFIIKKDIPHFGIDRIRQVEKLVKYKLAADFIVYKPEEVKQRLKLGDPFIRNILEEGKILYEERKETGSLPILPGKMPNPPEYNRDNEKERMVLSGSGREITTCVQPN